MGKKWRKPSISRHRLKELLHYDPVTGVFTWLRPQSNRVQSGEQAGCVAESGYRIIGIDGQALPASNLAVFYMTGEYPTQLVDHRNRDRSNDAYGNLRVVGYQENAFNAGCHADNRTGLKGVHRHYDGRWRAQISVGGKRTHIGLFNTPEEAHAAYLSKAKALHGEFFYGGENR